MKYIAPMAEPKEAGRRQHELTQLADARVGIGRDVAHGRLQFAGQDLHEGRLAGTVRTYEAITVVVAEHHGDVLEKGFRAELNRQICC